MGSPHSFRKTLWMIKCKKKQIHFVFYTPPKYLHPHPQALYFWRSSHRRAEDYRVSSRISLANYFRFYWINILRDKDKCYSFFFFSCFIFLYDDESEKKVTSDCVEYRLMYSSGESLTHRLGRCQVNENRKYMTICRFLAMYWSIVGEREVFFLTRKVFFFSPKKKWKSKMDPIAEFWMNKSNGWSCYWFFCLTFIRKSLLFFLLSQATIILINFSEVSFNDTSR